MIFVSVMTYALGKELGLTEAVAEFHAQVKEPSSDSLPAARVVARMARLEEIGLYIDPAATCIGKGRSRAFHAARESPADIWISVDDDMDADTRTLELLVESVRAYAEVPRVVFAPYWLREQEKVSAALEQYPIARPVNGGGETLSAVAGGFGLVAVNRAAMQRLHVEHTPALCYQDDDGVERLALFHDIFHGKLSAVGADRGRWYGEDTSFYKRCRGVGVRVEALATGHTMHCGRTLRLDQIGSLPRFELAGERITLS